MADNKDFWEELLGDEFGREIYNEFLSGEQPESGEKADIQPSQPEFAADNNEPPEDSAPIEKPAEKIKPVFMRDDLNDKPAKIRPKKADLPEKNYDNFIDELFGGGAGEEASPEESALPADLIPEEAPPPPAYPRKPAGESLKKPPQESRREPEEEEDYTRAWTPLRAEQPSEELPPVPPVPPVETPAVRPVPQQRSGDDFQMEFDFDREYGDEKRDNWGEKAVRRNREKRTGCLGGIMYFAFIIGISILLASLAWIAATDILALGDREGRKIEVTVPKDYDVDSITEMLYEEGLIKYKFLFKIYAQMSDADEKINAGTYELSTGFDYRALVHGMSTKGGKKIEVDVVIPEGYTLRQIFDLMEEKKVCYKAELWEAAANYDFDYDFLDDSTLGDKLRLEGFLFPDTYTFYVNDTPSRVISKLLSNFNRKFTQEYADRAAELGYSIRDIVNIASMIEKEAANNDERDTISSVIYNRLNNPNADTVGLLQIDATIWYAIAGTNQSFSTEIDDPYNTYVYKGLPPGPIANPGIKSIEAALYPEDTGYFYYALGTDKVHHFFKYYSSFIEFVNSDAYARSSN